MMPIGAWLNSAFQQMVYPHGYDHNLVLNSHRGDSTTFAARAYDPRSGGMIDCFTTEPGVQIYTSNGMNGSVVGSSGTTYRRTEAFTLETQHFPDSPNKPNFPTTELKPGQDFSFDAISASRRMRPCRHCRGEGRPSRSGCSFRCRPTAPGESAGLAPVRPLAAASAPDASTASGALSKAR
jgi:hypothetical protein